MFFSLQCRDDPTRTDDPHAKTTRNAIRDIRNTSDKATAEKNAPKVYAMIDKLAKIGLIHKNKASNLKSGIAVYINKLA